MVLILKEKLRLLQKVAVGLTFIAVTFLTIALGKPPYIALTLAFSFGFYGLVKKLADVDAIPSLTIETLLLTPFFSIFMFYLDSKNDLSFVNQGLTHAFWLSTAGIVTVIPLLLFGFAVVRIPLVVIGLLQALGPILQFLLGYYAFREPMTSARWFGFYLVWFLDGPCVWLLLLISALSGSLTGTIRRQKHNYRANKILVRSWVRSPFKILVICINPTTMSYS